MAISLNSIKKTTALSAPRVLIYGTAGVGKTTWASQAPDPVFIFAEDGAGTLEVDAFPVAQTYTDILDAISALYSEDHDFRTVVLDSLDHAEALIWDAVCAANQVESIEKLPYGRGYVEALGYWRRLLDGFQALRDQKNMTVILIAHSHIRRFESPEHDTIDRYEVKLHSKASALMQESVDAILFARHKTITKTEDLGFGTKRTRGISTGERVVCTTETPSYVAKNRYGLPAELPLDFRAFTAAIADSKQANQQPQEAA